MIDFTNKTNNKDNLIVANGVEFRVSDDVAKEVYRVLTGSIKKVSDKKVSDKLSVPKEKTIKVGSDYYSDACVDVRKVDIKDSKQKKYVVYITYFDSDDTEHQKKVRYAIKMNLKNKYGVEFAGDHNLNQYYWAFPSKKACDTFIEERKSYKDNAKKSKASA